MKHGMSLKIVLSILFFFSIFLYWDSLASLISIWESSLTYGHGYIILPIVTWLIYRKRHTLVTLPMQHAWFAFVGLIASSNLWFLAKLAGVNVIEYFSVFLLPAFIVCALWGIQGLRLLAFPLLFLFFAIPVGDFLIPYLQFFTADISVYMLEVFNIPVYRDGMFIQIPNGNFLVAEACSGIRFLISTITIGVLFAYLNMRSIKRRMLFIALSVFVPIIGNGLRAFLMILIGHLSNMKAAVGFDHLVYGWFFFGFILIILLMIGNVMAEPVLSDKSTDSRPNCEYSSLNRVSFSVFTLLLLALSSGPIANYWYIKNIQQIKLETSKRNAPKENAFPVASWQPLFVNADNMFYKSEHGPNNTFELFVVEYLYEGKNKELISGENSFFDKNIWSLDAIKDGNVTTSNNLDIPYTEYQVVNLKGQQRIIRVVYSVDDSYFSQKLAVKFAQLMAKLFNTDIGGKAFIFSTTGEQEDLTAFELFMEKELVSPSRDKMKQIF